MVVVVVVEVEDVVVLVVEDVVLVVVVVEVYSAYASYPTLEAPNIIINTASLTASLPNSIAVTTLRFQRILSVDFDFNCFNTIFFLWWKAQTDLQTTYPLFYWFSHLLRLWQESFI